MAWPFAFDFPGAQYFVRRGGQMMGSSCGCLRIFYFHISHEVQTVSPCASSFSNRNKKRVFRFTTPARSQREFVDGGAGGPV
jgi:hypothetical protein